ncbi:MAG: UDP-N-acetylglucosamine--N-acetylmuramyl-(pentapeptide) pyrophosphoryl-undecaprenol N-acetylglucosamine transferase [Pseudomonas citronellolis]|nr:MAG: UDP-N-acetylglucosamine--N-acetylmuramyl-(pentapeptide) pyrophosphoryl-undecaprenol N-acetylglucosamine transferase [Pseudomonas citronellolis]
MFGPDETYRASIQAARYRQWITCPWRGEQSEAQELAGLLAAQAYDFLVVDDYRAGSDFQRILAEAGARWLQFYAPNGEAIHADVALCSNPAARHDDLARRVCRPHCRLLVGLDYALLREEFVHIAPPRPRAGVQRLLLTFGGGDDRGLVWRILAELDCQELAGTAITVIAGRGNPRNASNLRALTGIEHLDVNYRVQPENVAALLEQADLAIMAGGTTTYEAARCGLPMLLLSLAANQIEQSLAMQRMGFAHYLGRHEDIESGALREHVLHLRETPGRLRAMSERAAAAVDGQGGSRVVDSILSFFAGHI